MRINLLRGREASSIVKAKNIIQKLNRMLRKLCNRLSKYKICYRSSSSNSHSLSPMCLVPATTVPAGRALTQPGSVHLACLGRAAGLSTLHPAGLHPPHCTILMDEFPLYGSAPGSWPTPAATAAGREKC